MSFSAMLRQWSACVPLAMSFAAFATVIAHVILFGAAREADEGTAAHLFQLLIVAQAPIVAFFAIRCMPRSPRHGLLIMALQLGAALVALAPVFYFGL